MSASSFRIRKVPALLLAALTLFALAPSWIAPVAQAADCMPIYSAIGSGATVAADDEDDAQTGAAPGPAVLPAPPRARGCLSPCFGTSWLLDTGASGVPGASDHIWKVLSGPGVAPGASPTAVNAYPGWVAPPGGALWVTTHATGTNAATAPAGDWVYAVDFSVPCIRNCHQWTMLFDYAADNHVRFELNGVPITGTVFDAFQTTRTVEHDGCALYRLGANRLTAHVQNSGGPTGLLVDGAVTINP